MSILWKLIETTKNILYYNDKESDNMIYPSIDKLLDVVGSKYLLVNLVAKRVDEMRVYKHYQIKENEYVSKKEIGRALEEVSKNLIQVK